MFHNQTDGRSLYALLTVYAKTYSGIKNLLSGLTKEAQCQPFDFFAGSHIAYAFIGVFHSQYKNLGQHLINHVCLIKLMFAALNVLSSVLHLHRKTQVILFPM